MSPEESVRKSSQLLRMRKMNFLGRRVSLFNGTGHELDKKQEGFVSYLLLYNFKVLIRGTGMQQSEL